MPPAGAVWAHLPDLSRGPEGLEAALQKLFAKTVMERSEAMLELIGWVLEASPNDG